MRNLIKRKIEVDLLDRDENVIGPLSGFIDGSIEYSIFTTVTSGGSIGVRDDGQDVDWVSSRIRPTLYLDGVPHRLGVFLASVPTDEWGDTGRIWSVELMDKTAILNQAVLPTLYAVPDDTNVVEAVASLIAFSGEEPGAITPLDVTTRGTIVWQAGTTILRAVNDLLAAANCYALWCDGNGQFQVRPYVAPAYRPIAAEFVDGENAIYTPDFTREQDIYSIPNRVVAVSQESGDIPALVGVATNENPDSPFSFQARGRWIDFVEDGVETTSQEAIDAYAARRLVDRSSAVANIEISNLYTTAFLNDAVRFRSRPAGIDRRMVLSKFEVPLTEVGLNKTTLREVVDV